jgi:hypothetical protein
LLLIHLVYIKLIHILNLGGEVVICWYKFSQTFIDHNILIVICYLSWFVYLHASKKSWWIYVSHLSYEIMGQGMYVHTTEKKRMLMYCICGLVGLYCSA